MLFVGGYSPATAIWTSTNRLFTQTRAYTRLLLIVKPPLPEFTHNYRLSIIVTIWKQSY